MKKPPIPPSERQSHPDSEPILPTSYLKSLSPSNDLPLSEVQEEIGQYLSDPRLMAEEIAILNDEDLEMLGISQMALSKGVPHSHFFKGIGREFFSKIKIDPLQIKLGIPFNDIPYEVRQQLQHHIPNNLMVRMPFATLLFFDELPEETRVHLPNLLNAGGELLKTLRRHDVGVMELKDIPIKRLLPIDLPKDLVVDVSYKDFVRYVDEKDGSFLVGVETVKVCAPDIQISLPAGKLSTLRLPVISKDLWGKILFAYENKNRGRLFIMMALLRKKDSLKKIITLSDPSLDDEHFFQITRSLGIFTSEEKQEIRRLGSWIGSLDFGGVIEREISSDMMDNLKAIFTRALKQKQFNDSQAAGIPLPSARQNVLPSEKYAYFRWTRRTFERIVFTQLHSFGIMGKRAGIENRQLVENFYKKIEELRPPLLVLFEEDADTREILGRVLGSERLEHTKIIVMENLPASNTATFGPEGRLCVAKFDTTDRPQFQKCLHLVLVRMLDLSAQNQADGVAREPDTSLEAKLVSYGHLAEIQKEVARRLWEACENIRQMPDGLGMILAGCPVTSHSWGEETLAHLASQRKRLPHDIQEILRMMLEETDLFTHGEIEMPLRYPEATDTDREEVRKEEQEIFKNLIQEISHHTITLGKMSRHLEHHAPNLPRGQRMDLLLAAIDAENIALIRFLKGQQIDYCGREPLTYAIKRKRFQVIKYLLHQGADLFRIDRGYTPTFMILMGGSPTAFQRAVMAEYLKVNFPGKSLIEILKGRVLSSEEKVSLCDIIRTIGKKILNHISDMVVEELEQIEERSELCKHIKSFYPAHRKEIARFLLLERVERAITQYNEDKKDMSEGEDKLLKMRCCEEVTMSIETALTSKVFPPDLAEMASELSSFVKEKKYIPRGEGTVKFLERCREVAIPSGLAVFEMDEKRKEEGIVTEKEDFTEKAQQTNDWFMEVLREVDSMTKKNSTPKLKPTSWSRNPSPDYERAKRVEIAKVREKKLAIRDAREKVRTAELKLHKKSAAKETARQQRTSLLQNEIELTKAFEKLQIEIDKLRKQTNTPELNAMLKEKDDALRDMHRKLKEMEVKKENLTNTILGTGGEFYT